MTLEAGGRVREKVRAVGERSEAAGGSDQRQGPWEVQQRKDLGIWLESPTDDVPVVIVPK